MKESWKHVSRAAAVAVVLGLGSGVIGAALTTNYLSTYAISLGDRSVPPRLSDERPRTTPQTYAEALSQVTESVLPGVARIYPTGSYAAPLVSGSVLTSDGWIVTKSAYLPGAGGLSVVVGGRAYAVEKMQSDAGASGATFLKIDATNLSVFAFGSGFDVQPGDQLFAVPSPTAVFSESAVEARWPAGALSSDRSKRAILVEDPLLGSYAGAPVVNVRGELVGIVDASSAGFTTIQPIDAVLPEFNALLRAGTIATASLGVLSTDLSRTLGLSESDTRGRTQGALLLGAASVKKGSAAAEGGLQPGDIVLSVDGVPVDAKRTLDELIVTRAPGDAVVLRVLRGDAELDVRVVLGAS